MKNVFTLSPDEHGGGPIYFTWQKGVHSNYLVTTGVDGQVKIFDRHGTEHHSLSLNGICTGLSWNREGDLLAIISDRISTLMLWESSTSKMRQLDSGLRDPLSLLLWSKHNSNLLAVTTSKGNLLLYDHHSSRKVPILGKHSKRIISGAWSEHQLLALVGEDHVLSVSNEEGDTLTQTLLKGEPSQLKFGQLTGGGWSVGSNSNDLDQAIAGSSEILDVTSEVDNCISLVLNRKQILLLLVQTPTEQPNVLTFAERYGEIIDYEWLTQQDQLLVTFSNGYAVLINSSMAQLGHELAYVKVFKDQLTHVAFSKINRKLVIAAKNILKFIDIGDIESVEQVHTLENETVQLEWIEWSADGQMLAIATSNGQVHVLLTKLKLIGDAFQANMAYLSSLLEVSCHLLNESSSHNSTLGGSTLGSPSGLVLKLDLEPQLIAIGTSHLAACINNRVCFYSLELARRSSRISQLNGNIGQALVREKEYASIVGQMKLNAEYAAVLFTSGELLLHLIDPPTDPEVEMNENESKESKRFPLVSNGQTVRYTAVELSGEFLIMCSSSGEEAEKNVNKESNGSCIELFSLQEWAVVSIFRHVEPIRLLNSDLTGVRLLLLDAHQNPFVYNAVDERLLTLDCSNNFNVTNLNSSMSSFDSTNHSINDKTSVDTSIDACLLSLPDFPSGMCKKLPVGQPNAAGEFPLQANHLLWDQCSACRHVFIAIDRKHVHVFSLVERSLQGRFVQFVGRCPFPPDESPLLLYDGTLYSHNIQGRLVQRPLPTHYTEQTTARKVLKQSLSEFTQLPTYSEIETQPQLKDFAVQPFAAQPPTPSDPSFVNLLRLRRYTACVNHCERVGSQNPFIYWATLVHCALHDLQVSFAMRVCRRLGWAGAVRCLRRLLAEEEAMLLAGHIAELLEHFELAEWMFLRSSQPIHALKMRQRLMQWDASITLAKRLQPKRLRWLHRQQALQAEFDGDHNAAVEHFGLALQSTTSIENGQDGGSFQQHLERSLQTGDVHTMHCVGGMGRAAAHLGNARRALELGMRLLPQVSNVDSANKPELKIPKLLLRKRLVLEIARALVQTKCVSEAAALFERAGEFEQASLLHLRSRNAVKVRELILKNGDRPMSNEILGGYAKLQEVEGRPREALKAFARAQMYTECVRLLLDKLNSPEEAVALAREKQVSDAYLLIARHYQKRNNDSAAIEFLVRGGRSEEAFSIAVSSSLMDHYAELLLDAYEFYVFGDQSITRRHSSSTIDTKKNQTPETATSLDQLVSVDQLDPLDLLHFDPLLPVATDPSWVRDFQTVAVYYEQERQSLQAGRFFCLAGQTKKGVRLLLQFCTNGASDVGSVASVATTTATSISIDPNSEKLALQLAVQYAPDAQDERCLRTLVDTLLGEQDGRPKDFRLLLQLHLRCGQSREAVRVALLLAKEQQITGAYREAHSLLRSVCVQLHTSGNRLPLQLVDSLHLLHCYQLLKLASVGQRLRLAAALLDRLCGQLGRFPTQAGSLLASAVVTYVKLGRKDAAKKLAGQLLRRPDWASQVRPPIRRKIEALVRRSALRTTTPGAESRQDSESRSNLKSASSIDSEEMTILSTNDTKADEEVELSFSCLHCGQPVPAFQLSCESCRGSMCFCILSCIHVRKGECVLCEGCQLPMIVSQLERWRQVGLNVCAMCGHALPNSNIQPPDQLDYPLVG